MSSHPKSIAEDLLTLAARKIAAFEQKYNTTFEHLQEAGLPDDAGIEMHEDFIEWAGWQRTYEEALTARGWKFPR